LGKSLALTMIAAILTGSFVMSFNIQMVVATVYKKRRFTV